MRQKRADQRSYHFIYKTVCLVTGKAYFGMHSTDDLDDGYLGSGMVLSRSIKKHGRENHRREILEFCSDRQILRIKEKEYVDESKVEDPMCMNLMIGGSATRLGHSEETRQKLSQMQKGKKIASDHLQKLNEGWRGQKHSDEARQKMRESIAARTPEMKAEAMKKIWDARREVGWTLPDDAKKRISEKQSGKSYSEESKQKRAESMRRHWATVTDDQRQAFKQKVSATKRAKSTAGYSGSDRP